MPGNILQAQEDEMKLSKFLQISILVISNFDEKLFASKTFCSLFGIVRLCSETFISAKGSPLSFWCVWKQKKSIQGPMGPLLAFSAMCDYFLENTFSKMVSHLGFVLMFEVAKKAEKVWFLVKRKLKNAFWSLLFGSVKMRNLSKENRSLNLSSIVVVFESWAGRGHMLFLVCFPYTLYEPKHINA